MDKLLELELRLILLRHGRRKVVQALATLNDQSPLQLDAELAAAESSRTPAKPRRVPSATELVADIAGGVPASAEALRKLAIHYDNRTFLPQLRDVQRFLERLGGQRKKLRSRREAAKEVFLALSKLAVDELQRIAASAEPAKDSDYALLAREIMRKSTAQGSG